MVGPSHPGGHGQKNVELATHREEGKWMHREWGKMPGQPGVRARHPGFLRSPRSWPVPRWP